MALAGVLQKAQVAGTEVDQVVLGSVIQNGHQQRGARRRPAAGVPDGACAHRYGGVHIANRAIADAALAIATGHADTALAGSVEMLGDVPVASTAMCAGASSTAAATAV